MGYSGATAASSVSNPPLEITHAGLGGINRVSTGSGGGNKVWRYDSSLYSSDMSVANFFTDAQMLGMQAGDIVLGTVTTSGSAGSSVSVYVAVLGPISTSGGAALNSSGGVLSSTR